MQNNTSISSLVYAQTLCVEVARNHSYLKKPTYIYIEIDATVLLTKEP